MKSLELVTSENLNFLFIKMLNNSTSQYFNARFCTVVVAENHSCNDIIDPLSVVRYNPCS